MSQIIDELRARVTSRIVSGEGRSPVALRRAAHANEGVVGAAGDFVAKIARDALEVTDRDVSSLRAAMSEDEVFELAVCAAVGEADRQYDAAMRCLDAEFGP